MNWKLYTVYDSKAELFLQPFTMRTRGEAVRAFAASANQQGHQFAVYGGDFTLFEIGDYEDLTGRMEQYDAPVNLGTALEYVSRDEEQE